MVCRLAPQILAVVATSPTCCFCPPTEAGEGAGGGGRLTTPDTKGPCARYPDGLSESSPRVGHGRDRTTWRVGSQPSGSLSGTEELQSRSTGCPWRGQRASLRRYDRRRTSR